VDLSTIAQLIGSVGFPIVVALLMIKQNDKITQIVERNSQATTANTEAIKAQSVMFDKLCDKIRGG
jgi:hypothetical protein